MCEEDEDFWHIYNLLTVGDQLTATTFRKVQTVGSTGSVKNENVRLRMTLLIDKLDFDSEGCQLRVSGKNIAESKYIKLGQAHTIQLALHKTFTVYKQLWDSMHLNRLKTACDVTKRAEIAAVVMQPGLANVCLLTKHMTVVRAKIEIQIPKKRAVGNSHNRAVVRFFKAIMEAIVKHIDFSVVKVCLLASPGFLKDDFKTYLLETALRDDVASITESKQKFLCCHAAHGYKHAIKDVLASEEVALRIADTRSFEEAKALQNFFGLLNSDPDRAFYGFNHCKHANENLAIEYLMVADSLIRDADVKVRKGYVDLIDSVKKNNGLVYIFSALHVSGDQLNQLGGIAAVLRYPMPTIANEGYDSNSDIDSDDPDAS